jgi:hypothetical protein
MTPDVQAYVEAIETHLRMRLPIRKPLEVMQQGAVQLLDYASPDVREKTLRALVGSKVKCPSCDGVPRIQRINFDYDLQLWCSTESCSRYDTSFLDIELKPDQAKAIPSRITYPELHALERDGAIMFHEKWQVAADPCGETQPACKCFVWVPQVIAHKRKSVPALFLTDHYRTVAEVYDKEQYHFDIVGVRLRRIADGVTEIVDTIDISSLAPDDRRLVQLAVAALWMRMPWRDFISITQSERFQRYIPADFLAEALTIIQHKYGSDRGLPVEV